MARLVTIYWRDIPAHVNAQSGRLRQKAPMPARFEDAIAKAAAVAGLFTYHEFVGHWRRTDRPCGDDLIAEAAKEAALLNESFSDETLAHLVRNGGSSADGVAHPPTDK